MIQSITENTKAILFKIICLIFNIKYKNDLNCRVQKVYNIVLKNYFSLFLNPFLNIYFMAVFTIFFSYHLCVLWHHISN